MVGSRDRPALGPRLISWPNITPYLGNNGGVSSQSEFQELAYLFLKWSGSTRIFSLMTGNPGGFFDPFQLANFADPLVNQSYHDYHVPVIKGTVARAVPTLAIPGQFAMHNTLSENLLTAMTGGMTAKEAMSVADRMAIL